MGGKREGDKKGSKLRACPEASYISGHLGICPEDPRNLVLNTHLSTDAPEK